MKVLFVSAWFPSPPDNGSRIRVYSLMKAISRKHEVYLVSLMQEDSREENAEKLNDFCEVLSLHDVRWFSPKGIKPLLGLFSRRPRSAVCTYDSTIHKAVEDAVDKVSPDVIVVSTLGAVEYVNRGFGIPMVLEEHNCEYAVIRRSAGRISGKLRKLRYDLAWMKFARWEGRMCRQFDAVAMVSKEDRRMILEVAPTLPDVRVIPNGVDAGHYDPTSWCPQGSTLLYNGALTYSANFDAVQYYADSIYPVLRDRLPDAKLLITGRADGVDVTGIADCPGIELIGYVNDIRDVLRKTAACVVPLREGGGSRLKILEAMAAGVPVVSTSMGAEGISASPGEHLLIANTPRDLSDAIVRLLSDRSLADSLRSSARKLVEQYYGWDSIGAQFTDMLEEVVASRRKTSVSDTPS